MIIKAFNQEFNVNINTQTSQFNQKVLLLLQSKRVDLLTELNDFIKTAWDEYEKARSAAEIEYHKVRSAVWAEGDDKVVSIAKAEYNKIAEATKAKYSMVTSTAWLEYGNIISTTKPESDRVISVAKKIYSAVQVEFSQKITEKIEELLRKV